MVCWVGSVLSNVEVKIEVMVVHYIHVHVIQVKKCNMFRNTCT